MLNKRAKRFISTVKLCSAGKIFPSNTSLTTLIPKVAPVFFFFFPSSVRWKTKFCPSTSADYNKHQNSEMNRASALVWADVMTGSEAVLTAPKVTVFLCQCLAGATGAGSQEVLLFQTGSNDLHRHEEQLTVCLKLHNTFYISCTTDQYVISQCVVLHI